MSNVEGKRGGILSDFGLLSSILIILSSVAFVAPAAIFINSFNSGQLSKDLKVRQDLDKATMGSEKATDSTAGSTPLNTSSTNSEKIAA